jgi:hypothetical protein
MLLGQPLRAAAGKTGQSNGVVLMAGEPEQGLATAARLAAGERGAPARPDDEVEQLDLSELLGLPPVNGSKGQVVTVRKPGTRAGIRNNRTQEWDRWFRERGFRFPIEIFMAYANMSVDELRKRLGCSALEATNVILRAAGEAAPLLHARLASIELKRDGEPGGRSSRLEIEGSLVDVTPQTTTDRAGENSDLG